MLHCPLLSSAYRSSLTGRWKPWVEWELWKPLHATKFKMGFQDVPSPFKCAQHRYRGPTQRVELGVRA